MAGIGFRVKTKIERAPESLVEQFAQYPTGNIVDAMGRFGAMEPGVKPVSPGMKFAGSALTVRIRACDNLVIYKALELAQPGDVLVIATSNFQGAATWGDLTSMIAKAKGAAAMVTDGMVRDVDGIRQVGLPVFAHGATPNSPFKDGEGEVNFTVTCGGVTVRPGDIVVGDGDGVVVIPREECDEVVKGVAKVVEKERQTIANIQAGRLIPEWVAKTLAERGCTFVD
ncbi:MAG: RraA family protein [candidate division NC10 bacterium]|nr:RraA family protein [candidate division NC10 bacterium]